MKRLVLNLALATGVLLAVLAYRTLVVPLPDYLQIQPVAIGIANLDQAAQHLSGAIKIKTVSNQPLKLLDPRAFRAFHSYLEETYPRIHENLERLVINRYSLLYHWQGSDPELEPVLLVAHFDTVPVIQGSEERWSHPPYSGAVAEGHVWGRGTLDDKGNIIAQMDTIEQLLAEGYQPRRSIYLAYGHDEEVGGRRGARKISEVLRARDLRFSLVLDEGSAIGKSGLIPGLKQPVALLGNAEKGYISLRLTAQDSGGHSAMPPRNSAAGRIGYAVARLEQTQMPARLAHNSEFFDHIMPFLPYGQRLLLSNGWLFESLLLAQMEQRPELNATVRTTTAVTMLSGSPKDNVLPTEASAVVNFRIMPGETFDDVIRHVERVLNDDSISIETESTGIKPSPVSPVDGPTYALLERTARESWRDDTLLVAPRLVLVTTDTRHYHKLSNNVFRFMPAALDFTDIQGIHGSNERLSLVNLENMLRFYRRLIINADNDDSLTSLPVK